MLLAIDDGRTTGTVAGQKAKERLYALPSTWISPGSREQALVYGYKIQTPISALVEHLESIARRHADELLSRDATKHLIDELRAVSPTIVDELIPSVTDIQDIQWVLRALLRENVPVRQLNLILESIGDASRMGIAKTLWPEHVRMGLARTLCSQFRDAAGVLHAVRMTAEMEECFEIVVEQGDESMNSQEQSELLDKETADFTCKMIRKAVKNLLRDGHAPVLVVSPSIRRCVKHVTGKTMPWLNVLSTREITSDTIVETIHILGESHTAAA